MLFAFRASILRITLALQGFQSALLRGPKDANLVRMVVTVLFHNGRLNSPLTGSLSVIAI